MSSRTAIWILALAAALAAAAMLVRAGRPPSVQPPVPSPSAIELSAHLRIVALAPGLTETLRRMQLGGAVVGRHGFDAWAPSTVLVCGDQSGLDAENLLHVRPTHLYVQWGQRELPATIRTLAEKERWTVRNFHLLSLQQIGAAADDLYSDARKALPESLRPPSLAAERFADSLLGRGWAAATAIRSETFREFMAQAGPVLMLYNDREPAAAAGPGSYHYEILSLLGATPAITTGNAYQTLDRETVRRINPSVLIVLKPQKLSLSATPVEPVTFNASELRSSVGLEPDSETKVILVDDPLAFVPGLNLIELIDTIQRELEKLLPSQ